MVEQSSERSPGELRVFVVDDDQMMAEMVEARLDGALEEATVVSATDPRACLDAVSSGRADCVVSDYDMPEMDGLDLLREVRAVDDHLPFVLYTGRGSEEIASEAISAGVTDYLQKGGSDTLELLANSVDRALDRRRTEYERERARWSLAEKDATLESLFESIPSPCVLVDVGCDSPSVRRVNGTFVRRFDVDSGEVIGGDLTAVVDADADLRRAVADGGVRRTDIRCETTDGPREFLATAVPAAGSGDLRYLVLTDVDERKRLQRSLAALHDATRELLRCESAAAVERTALEAAAEVIGFPHNGTRRYDAETDTLVPGETTAAAADHFDRPRSAYHRGDPEATDAWTAFETGEVVTVEAGDRIQRDGVASKVYLSVGDWGVITLSDPERTGVDETEEYLGRVLAANMAAVLSRFVDDVELPAGRR